MDADQRTFVIVGASLAGAKAAETLRAEGYTGRIVLIGEEDSPPYERPPLSKGHLLGKPDALAKAFVHTNEWYTEHNIELMLGRRVTAIDRSAHTVTLDGGDAIGYDKLLLATGSRVRHLDVPGVDASGVRYLRTIEESDALLEALRDGARVVVVGAGWIGLETAAAARQRGCEVTVVELDRLPLRRVLGDEVAALFRDLHQANGVQFRFGAKVREFTVDSGRVTGVVLDDGSEMPAELVVVGVGISPATELAEAAGLEVDNGVVTDDTLRTSDPDIFACGDVASSYHPLIGERIRVEHWANALNGGKAAAASMLGQPQSYARVPYFFSDQYDLGMEYSGYVEPDGYDRVVFRGGSSIVDGKAPETIVFWTRDGRVLAGMNVNVWDVTDPIQALVRSGFAGKAVDLDRLADPEVPLADLTA